MKKLLLSVFFCLSLLTAGYQKTFAQYCTAENGGQCDEALNEISFAGIYNVTGCNDPGGYVDYTSMSGTVTQGGINYFSAKTTLYYSTDAVDVWIDWNNNQDFMDAGEYFTTTDSSGSGIFYANILVPLTATVGNTTMRVRIRYGGNANEPCGTAGSTYGEVEDYSLTIVAAAPCSAIPAPGSTLSSNTFVCNGDFFTLSFQNYQAESGLTFQWQSSADGATWTNIASATSPVLVTNQSNDTYYQCIVNCSGFGSATSSPVLVSQNTNILECYCIPPVSGDNCQNMYIENVAIGSINMASGCTPGTTYEDYTSESTSIIQGSTIPISLSSFQYGMAYSLWLDMNDNGVFETNENLLIINNTSGSLMVTDNLTIPITSTVGAHRLRISGGYFQQGVPSDPCAQIGYGETEDYTLTISAAPMCSAIPSPGNTLSSDSLGCSNKTIILRLQNYQAENGLTYQWQTSSDGATWTNAVSDTSSTMVTNQITDTYYQCVVTCVGFVSSISSPLFVPTGDFSQCYCTPKSNGSPCITNVTVDALNNTTGDCSVGNYSKQTATTTLMKEMTYPLSVTTDADAIISAWIDYNHNGAFDTWEWQQVTLNSTPGVPSTINILLPDSALTGITGMRIYSRASGAQNGAGDACRTNGSGEAEDYLITIINAIPCSAVPSPGNTLASDTLICSGKNFTLSVQNVQMETGLSYQWQSSTNGTSWANKTGATSSSLITSQTANRYYRCKVTCSGFTSAYSTTVLVSMKNVLECYCDPVSFNPCSPAYISNVTIDSINVTSTCSTGYENNSLTQSTSIMQGSVIPVSFSSFGYGFNYALWIDLNDNGIFDATELLLTINNPSELLTITDNLTIPITAQAGPHRLRIMGDSYWNTPPSDPCGQLQNGETEDYTINITAAPTCSSIPNPGNTLTSDTSVCAGINFTLTIQNTPIETGLSYQWKTSLNGTSWTSISGATSSSLVTSIITASKYYRCRVTCSGFGFTESTPVLVNLNTNILECYCIPPVAVDPCNMYIEYVNIDSIIMTSTCSTVTTYEDYSSSQSTSVMQGATFPISLSSGGSNGLAYTIWLDMNDDGVFDFNEILLSITNNSGLQTLTDTLIIPITTQAGPHRLRIMGQSFWYGTPTDPCGQLQGGETEDYTLTITAAPSCSAVPSPGNTLSSAVSVCAGIDFTLSIQNNPLESGLTYQWQSSSDNVSYIPIAGATNTTYTTAQTTATYYRCVVTCTNSGSSANSNPVNVLMNSVINCYCTSMATTTGDEEIFNVTVGTLNNTSDCSTTGGGASILNQYSDYTSTVTAPTLMQGLAFSFSIEIGTCGGNYASGTAIFIDYNQNGDFTDAGEQVYGTAITTDGPHFVTGSFDIPLTAVTGNTRMRVVNEEGNPGTSISPCSSYGYGETEDYVVTIMSATPCSSIPTPGNTLTSAVTVCSGNNFTLSFQNNPIESGLSFQWQSSPDGATWSNIDSATSSTLTTNQTSSTYYQCIVSCSGFGSSASVPVLVNVNTNVLECFCVPPTSISPCLFTPISNVTIDSINVNSTCSGISYQDYSSSQNTSVMQGSTIPISLSSNGTGSAYTIWLDLNDNGIFEATEILRTINNGSGDTTITDSISIPLTASSGMHRLRIRADYFGNGAPTDPCNQLQYGETQDFNLTVFISCSELNLSLTSINPKCNSSVDGVINSNVSGGTSPYSYSWSDSQISANISGLTSGTYSLTITDSKACIDSASVTLNDPLAVTAILSGTNPTCNGAVDGSATVTATGGSGVFFYSWLSGDSTASISGMISGAYVVTVTDENSCTTSGSVILSDPPLLTLSVVGNNPSCYGGNDGVATAIGGGGTGGYTYIWNEGQTTSSISELIPGEYFVTLTDTNSCSVSGSVNLNNPKIITINISGTNPSCNGSADGSAVVTGIGGTGSLSYLWSTGTTSDSDSGLTAGTYTVTLTDENSCTKSISVSLTEPATLTSSISGTSPACNGETSGSASVTASGGFGSLSYLWSSGQTSPVVTNLSMGDYTVTITDDNSCTQTNVVTISQPGLLSVTLSGTSPSCNGLSNGTASALAASGTSPYFFNWSNGASMSLATNLSAGTSYIVTVTDVNSCTQSASIILSEPSAISATLNGTDPTCNSYSDGSATAIASGGTGAFSYSWSNSTLTDINTNLLAGNYTVTITDENSCKEIKTITLNEPAGIVISASIVNPACVTADGAANISSGGIAPFSYSWSNGVTDSINSTITAGTYTVTVTDANSCTASQSVYVENITAPVLTLNASSPGCNGGNDGVIIANLVGGTPPFVYLWSNGKTTAFISGLVGDIEYQLTVTDANNCLGIAGVILTNPDPISLSVSGIEPLCNGENSGSASAVASGGTGAFTYLWSNSQSTSTATGISSGTYTITVTDGNSCTRSSSILLTEPSALSSTVSGTSPACNAGTNGSSSVSASGGTQPYTYLWSGGQTSAIITGLTAGTFTVTITDANSCTQSNSIIITEFTALSLTVSGTDPLCNGKPSGSAIATASGGNGTYFYNWSTGVTNATAANLSAGVLYGVTVTDGKSCTQSNSILLSEPTAIITSTISSDPACYNQSTGNATVNASGGTGAYSYLWNEGQTTQTASGLSAGTYFVTVTDANVCTGTNSVSLNEPAILSLTVSGTNPNCNGGTNGSATASAGGGTSPYAFVWNSGQVTQAVSSLGSGTYKVTVTDANSCTMSGSVTLASPTALFVSVTGTNSNCNGGANGTANLTASGGTPVYVYLWSTGETTSAMLGLSSGNYTVTVTDVNNCTITGNVTLTDPPVLTFSVTGNNPGCNGGTSGTANTTPGGGTPGYTYIWNGGATTQNLSSLSAGTYTATVTDAKGCTLSGSVTLSDPTLVTASVTGTNLICSGGTNGSATVTGGGGTGVFTYLWSNATTTTTISNLIAGTYTVTVFDGNSCTATSNVTLTAPPALTVSVTGTNVNCNTGTKGTVSATPSGGTSGYTYSWSTGETSSSVTNLSNGSYTVTVTDAKGCTVSGSALVSVPAALILGVTGTNSKCSNETNGIATSTPIGGTPGYTYLWSVGATTQTISGLSAGTYSVTVTDTKSCTISGSVTLTNPAVLSIILTGTNLICNGGTNGSATAMGSGGTGTLTYAWATGETISTLSSLSAGTFTCTVMDVKNCIASANITLTEPSAITISLNGNYPSCNGGTDGSITTTPGGGAGFYTYKWNGGATSQNRTVLSAGTYTVTVSDAKNCTNSANTILVEPTSLIISITKTDATGSTASDGTASVTQSGGTSPYSYSWSTNPVQTTATAINLKTGTYTVTLTDSKGCIAMDTVFIDFPDILTEAKFAKNISVYPNPTNGILNIEFGKMTDEKVEIQLIDLTGRLVHRETYNISNATSIHPININQVSTGSYYLIITGKEDMYRVMVKVE